MKGAFNANPNLKPSEIWNLDVVLSFLASWGPNSQLSLKQLLCKSVALLALVSACRVSELANLDSQILKRDSSWSFRFLSLKKNSTPKQTFLDIEIFAFHQEDFCPLACLELYLLRTAEFRGDIKNVFITLSKPYRAARPNTIAKHLKFILSGAGIDLSRFSAHSFRAASTSKALSKGVSVEDILSRATWSTESTFSRFYAKTLIKGKHFSEAVLSNQL
jgi:integrase